VRSVQRQFTRTPAIGELMPVGASTCGPVAPILARMPHSKSRLPAGSATQDSRMEGTHMKSARILVSMLSLSLVILPAAMAAEKDSPAKEQKEGASIFESKCAACHGKDAKGETSMGKTMKIRNLHSADVQKQTKEELYKIIEDGKGKMPVYKGKLSKDQINDLVDYIKSLK
jgi:cytochrome c6